MNGKGSLRRPGDEAAYRDGWERVFGRPRWSKTPEEREDGLYVFGHEVLPPVVFRWEDDYPAGESPEPTYIRNYLGRLFPNEHTEKLEMDPDA